MQIIIDIPEDIYNAITKAREIAGENFYNENNTTMKAVIFDAICTGSMASEKDWIERDAAQKAVRSSMFLIEADKKIEALPNVFRKN